MGLSARYLSRLPNELVDLFSKLEQDIISDICRRIAKTDYTLTATADWQIYKIKQMGYNADEINKLISKTLGISKKKVEEIIKDACSYSYDNDTQIYEKAKAKGVDLGTILDLEDTPNLRDLVDAGIKQTQWEMENFCRTMAITSQNQFIQALDRAWLQVKSGAFTSEQAIKNAVQSLGRDGIKTISYASGRTDQVDVAVRRAVVTGVNQTTGQVNLTRMYDMGVDLVITTSHIGARPDHQVWQGKVFSYSGTSTKYPAFIPATGYGTVSGLKGANCRHDFLPYVEGVSENTLKQYDNEKSNKVYEQEQEQRRLERMIRYWKRRENAMKSAGIDSTRERMKVREWQAKQRKHIELTGLPRQYDRERV